MDLGAPSSSGPSSVSSTTASLNSGVSEQRVDPLQRSATPKCSPHRGRRRVSGTRRRPRTLCVLSASLRPFLPENLLLRVHRTPFAARQEAANPWKAKEHLWQKLLAETPHDDPGFALADSFPLPACLFARAYRAAPSLRRRSRLRQGHPPQTDLLRL
jgi:hypothetical protein